MKKSESPAMSDAALEARRAYYRAWYHEHRDDVQRQRAERWEREAAKNTEQAKDGENNERD